MDTIFDTPAVDLLLCNENYQDPTYYWCDESDDTLEDEFYSAPAYF